MSGCKIGKVTIKNAYNIRSIGENSPIDDPVQWPLVAALKDNAKRVLVIIEHKDGTLSYRSNFSDAGRKYAIMEEVKSFMSRPR